MFFHSPLRNKDAREGKSQPRRIKVPVREKARERGRERLFPSPKVPVRGKGREGDALPLVRVPVRGKACERGRCSSIPPLGNKGAREGKTQRRRNSPFPLGE